MPWQEVDHQVHQEEGRGEAGKFENKSAGRYNTSVSAKAAKAALVIAYLEFCRISVVEAYPVSTARGGNVASFMSAAVNSSLETSWRGVILASSGKALSDCT